MKHWFCFILGKMLPERLIRTLFLSSLYSQLFQVNTLDVRVYRRLNEIMKICDNDNALGLGMHYAKVFWGDEELAHIEVELNEKGHLTLSENTIEAMAKRIVEETPRWMRYAQEDMLTDIKQLLQCRGDLLSQA